MAYRKCSGKERRSKGCCYFIQDAQRFYINQSLEGGASLVDLLERALFAEPTANAKAHAEARAVGEA